MAPLPSPRTLLPLSLFVILLLALPLCLLAGDGQQANAPSPVPNPSASAKDLEEQGDALRAQKRYLDSLDFYSAAIAKHPTALLWNKKGMAYLLLKKFPEATKCFDRAIKADRNAPEGYNNRGFRSETSHGASVEQERYGVLAPEKISRGDQVLRSRYQSRPERPRRLQQPGLHGAVE